ncbi:phage portal protein [uncultured Agitococcus sp.]|uniref:phage portal protein n=1 Tax=uncultured Agitococcus sp. TaxID=1506599 RepID=UPI0026329051|nr:phage portal protein [uncultured Agitococcus sp.]
MSVWTSITSWFGLAPAEPKRGRQYASTVAGATAKPVTFDTAMTVSAVFACIRLLAETVSSLPLNMYKLDSEGNRTLDSQHDLIKLLKYRPNRRQTRIEFFEQLMLNLVSSGNAYVLRGMMGKRLVSLQVLNSGSVEPELLANGDLIYHWQQQDGTRKKLTEAEVWHVRLFGNGLVGLSPLSHAKKAIGVALAGDDKITHLMSNGAKPTGTLLAQNWPTKEQRDALRTEMNGLINGDQTELAVLGGGMKFEAMSLTPEDLELLATRRFSLEEIARIFGVPSVLINDTSASTVWGSGIDSIINGFYKFDLRPYLEKLEISMVVNLLPRTEWESYELEFDADAILRANLKDRVEATSKQVLSGYMTPNEARKSEGRQPKPNGDQLLVPSNMTTIDKILAVVPTRNKEETL